ncbi:hypothetical protein [Lysobacter enzymogenes]|uniref:hypothetical protein n=1 Tax=Lysobacter enzymogenes TaxID=69 RepID=UPI001A963707|nr:hypothetical protein [Lysobacter enzymogenes]QQP97388.1 hypothetical protein JHW38_04945 [Lysobacter enzymogenes]
MKQARIAALALAVALAACSKPPAAAPEAAQPAAPAAAAQPVAAAAAPAAPAAAAAAERPALPEGACAKTEDGFDSFLEAYVGGDPAVRAAYTAPEIEVRELKDPAKLISKQPAAQAGPFRIALIDSQWSYFEPGKADGELARIQLDRKLEGDKARVDYVKAEFSPDEEVVKTLGAPEAYVFEHQQGCWQLTLQLR